METLTIPKTVGVGMALAGAAIIITLGGHTSSKSSDRKGSPLFGILLMLLVTSCSAVFVTLQRTVLDRFNSLTTTAYTYTAGFILVGMSIIPNPPSPWTLKGGYVAVVYAMLASSCLAYALGAHGNKLTSPALVNIAALGSPLFTAGLSKLFLSGTDFGVYHAVGGSVTIVGFLLLSWAKLQDWKKHAAAAASVSGGEPALLGSGGINYTDMTEEGSPLILPPKQALGARPAPADAV